MLQLITLVFNMRLIRLILLLFFITTFSSCYERKNSSEIDFDASFLSARLDSVKKTGKDSYTVFINPAFEPVNQSPWFAFGITGKAEKEIELKLNYGSYKHRYIPKLSLDKESWKAIEDSKIKIDTSTGIATIKLKVSPRKLYVAAQEITSSVDTYVWLDSILRSHKFLQKKVAGKTVMQNDNFVVISRSNNENTIVLIARQHPPEIPGGTIGFRVFFEELLGNNETSIAFRKAFNIIAFPLLNPDGVDNGNWRHNANGIDLNRDWIDFTQPETKMVKKYLDKEIEKGARISFAIDFHTSYSGPYLLVLDSVNEIKTKKIIPTWIQNIETNSQLKVEARRRNQELPYCYNYFYNQFGSEAVTYEEGDEIDRALIRRRAKVYAQEFMKTMLLMNNRNE
jgi:hypothetical protein